MASTVIEKITHEIIDILLPLGRDINNLYTISMCRIYMHFHVLQTCGTFDDVSCNCIRISLIYFLCVVEALDSFSRKK